MNDEPQSLDLAATIPLQSYCQSYKDLEGLRLPVARFFYLIDSPEVAIYSLHAEENSEESMGIRGALSFPFSALILPATYQYQYRFLGAEIRV